MMRKLVVFLTTAMMVAMPLAVHALGFGSIKLNSALDEPLDAYIELLSPTPDDISNIKVTLAPPAAFMRAGIDRPIFLEKLKFAVKQDENGTYYIHVSTKDRVREPFLDFLLEMEWRNGRMVREYTMLLDPPGTARKAPAVVEAPATAAPEQVARQEQAMPAETPFAAPAPTAEPVPVPVPFAAAPVAAESSEFVLAEGEQMPRIPLNENLEPEPAPAAKAPQAAAPVEPVPVPAPTEPEAAVEAPSQPGKRASPVRRRLSRWACPSRPPSRMTPNCSHASRYQPTAKRHNPNRANWANWITVSSRRETACGRSPKNFGRMIRSVSIRS